MEITRGCAPQASDRPRPRLAENNQRIRTTTPPPGKFNHQRSLALFLAETCDRSRGLPSVAMLGQVGGSNQRKRWAVAPTRMCLGHSPAPSQIAQTPYGPPGRPKEMLTRRNSLLCDYSIRTIQLLYCTSRSCRLVLPPVGPIPPLKRRAKYIAYRARQETKKERPRAPMTNSTSSPCIFLHLFSQDCHRYVVAVICGTYRPRVALHKPYAYA